MSWENEISEAVKIVKNRMLYISQIANKLDVLEKSGELTVSQKELMTSMIHMTMNRWFRSKNRLHELVIYEFLSRHYASELARRNNNTKK